MSGEDLVRAFGGTEEQMLEDMLRQKKRQEQLQRKKSMKNSVLLFRAIGLSGAAAAIVLLMLGVWRWNRTDPVILPPGMGTTEALETEESMEDTESAEILYGTEYDAVVRHDGATAAQQWETGFQGGPVGRAEADLDGDGTNELILVSLDKTENRSLTYDGGESVRTVLTPTVTVYEPEDGKAIPADTLDFSALQASSSGTSVEGMYDLACAGDMLAEFFLYTVSDETRLVMEIHRREWMFADGSSDVFAVLRYSDGRLDILESGYLGTNQEGGWQEQEYLQKLARLGIPVPGSDVPIRNYAGGAEGIARITYETTATFDEKAAYDTDAESVLTAGKYRIAEQKELSGRALMPGSGTDGEKTAVTGEDSVPAWEKESTPVGEKERVPVGGYESAPAGEDESAPAGKETIPWDRFMAAGVLFGDDKPLLLRNSASGLLLDVYGDEGHSEELSNVQLYPEGSLGNLSQRFFLVSRGPMWYSLIPLSNEELAVSAEAETTSDENGSNVIVSALSPEDMLQGWTPEWVDGRWILHSVSDIRLALAAEGTEAKSNVRLVLLDYDDELQYWEIETAKEQEQ